MGIIGFIYFTILIKCSLGPNALLVDHETQFKVTLLHAFWYHNKYDICVNQSTIHITYPNPPSREFTRRRSNSHVLIHRHII